jgi:lipopolysaccharide biosynthesis regulator YciM
MEFELWMLLVFPLFFAMGWLTARMDIKELLSESSLLPRSYFQGLNFLLSEQQDKAIEAFIEVVKVDPQTIELHFALGSLFRKRGEVDRALRMHLNLVERADLDDDRKKQALFELAQDYLKAGILDRAELAFQQLHTSPYAKESLDFLLEIYQKEKDWLKAIDICQRLTDLTGQPHNKEASAFYCELASNELAHKQTEAAVVHLEQALEVCPQAVRATIMLGELESAPAIINVLSTCGSVSSSRMHSTCRWRQIKCCTPIAKLITKMKALPCCRNIRQSTLRKI